jgi:hypothetical protein
MNEISFMSWAGGDEAYINPFETDRGHELKHQIVRATIAAVDAIREVLPHARFVSPEPLIHIIGDPLDAADQVEAEAYRRAMYQAWDMISGRLMPELGGTPEHLDILGVNFYPKNQWYHNGGPIVRTSEDYRPFREMLMELFDRYHRPMLISETGTEDGDRADWLAYVASEVKAARDHGVPVEGICLYPIVNHPGWDDDRHCHNGLFDYANEKGERRVYEPLKKEIEKQNEIFNQKLPERGSKSGTVPDLICLSHLRFGFVFQRPQHLMTRFASDRRVFFFEEPIIAEGDPKLVLNIAPEGGVHIMTPHLPAGMSPERVNRTLERLLHEMIQEYAICDYIAWYYTPMATTFTGSLKPVTTVYDCMDELSGFKGAPTELSERERLLFQKADLVFTGGVTLYEHKRKQHPRVYPFPSGVDVEHFAQARHIDDDPPDQAQIPHPRLGYIGVIDERMDLDLLRGVAEKCPDWHLVLVGPVVKIEQDALPKNPNIHYLGSKKYPELPSYLAGWDVAILPFARNESTRFISPTKTPEYLAAGKPVVSTSITDVVRPYKELGLVHIADTADDFVTAASEAMDYDAKDRQWLARADEFLKTKSWNAIWSGMNRLIREVIEERKGNLVKDELPVGAGTIQKEEGAQTCSIS